VCERLSETAGFWRLNAEIPSRGQGSSSRASACGAGRGVGENGAGPTCGGRVLVCEKTPVLRRGLELSLPARRSSPVLTAESRPRGAGSASGLPAVRVRPVPEGGLPVLVVRPGTALLRSGVPAGGAAA
jgi:hypothetical protein